MARQQPAADRAWQEVAAAGSRGMTWKELAAALDIHHGSASSALSHLHRADRLARLQERRDHCSVYVDTEALEGRETRPYRVHTVTVDVGGAEHQAAVEEAYNSGYKAGREDAGSESWLIGYEAAKAEEGASADDILQNGIAEGYGRGVAATKVNATRVIERMYHHAVTSGPVAHHDNLCWMKHPGCAFKAAMKAVEKA